MKVLDGNNWGDLGGQTTLSDRRKAGCAYANEHLGKQSRKSGVKSHNARERFIRRFDLQGKGGRDLLKGAVLKQTGKENIPRFEQR